MIIHAFDINSSSFMGLTGFSTALYFSYAALIDMIEIGEEADSAKFSFEEDRLRFCLPFENLRSQN